MLSSGHVLYDGHKLSQPHTHTMHVAHAAPGTAHTLDSVWWKKRGEKERDLCLSVSIKLIIICIIHVNVEVQSVYIVN